MQVSSVAPRLSFVVETFFLKLGTDIDFLVWKLPNEVLTYGICGKTLPCEFSVELISCCLFGTRTTNRTPGMLMPPGAVFKLQAGRSGD
jgi:hypothetical protein